jgi:glycosyltransferase involved in cell wall biosynthesis
MQAAANVNDKSLLVIIPAYNEGSRIEPVIAAALEHLPVVVIDDGSSDNTPQVAGQAGAHVVHQQPNQGKGAALKAGFNYAIQQDYRAVITLDADGQHDPAEIPKFVEAFQNGHTDLVIGARDFREIPPVRRLANWLGKRSLSWAMGETILDNQSGYRLIGRRLMQDMLAIQQEGFEFEVEMIVACVQRGYDLEWVKIRTIYGGESSHINPVKHLTGYVGLVYRTRQSVRKSTS